jgi:hypothetical protein
MRRSAPLSVENSRDLTQLINPLRNTENIKIMTGDEVHLSMMPSTGLSLQGSWYSQKISGEH